jgi:crossover junction endodeoxyribonuclease RuvC
MPADHSKPQLGRTVLGVDLSLTSTGWAIANGEGIVCKTLVTPKTLRGDARLHWLDLCIAEIIEPAPGSDMTAIDLVVIEGASFRSKSSSADEIAGLHRIVRLGLFRRKIPYVIVAPIQLKKFATGIAKADKSLIVREVWRRWEVDVFDSDQADAVVLAQIGRGILGDLEMTVFQQEVAAKVAKKYQEAVKEV